MHKSEDDTSPMVLLGRSVETLGQTYPVWQREQWLLSPGVPGERERDHERGGRGEEQLPG